MSELPSRTLTLFPPALAVATSSLPSWLKSAVTTTWGARADRKTRGPGKGHQTAILQAFHNEAARGWFGPPVLPRYEHIRWLDVAVDDPLGMRVLNCVADRGE